MFVTALASLCLFVQPQTALKDEMQKLNFLVGDWTSHEKVSPGATPQEFDLTGNCAPVMGGTHLAIQESFELPKGTVHHNFIILSFDKETAKYRAWWHTNSRPVPIQFTGVFEGLKFVLTSDSPALRITYFDITSDAYHAQLEIQADGKWQLRTDAFYKRKKSQGI